MRLEALTVALRARSPWEAVELGNALVRRHAAAIWRPWLALTLPVLVLANLLAWTIDAIWLAAIVMWWLKPAFDRVPLYVLSRAVFGDVPGTARTLRAQGGWGTRWLPAYLGWRRLGPARSLLMPVDLLEDDRGEYARARRRALGRSVYGVGSLLTTACAHFELAIYAGALAGVLMFVPNEYLPGLARGFFDLVRDQPAWLQFAFNGVAWLATTVVEPFYIGAGFALYLNRRTQIEAWDIELALRRMGARLQMGAQAAAVVLVVGALLLPLRGHAQARAPAPVAGASVAQAQASARTRPTPLQQVFTPLADDRSLRKAVANAFKDPTLSPRRKVSRWVSRDAAPPSRRPAPVWLRGLGHLFGLLGEIGLWLGLGAIALALVLTARRWWPWLRGTAATLRPEPAEPSQAALPVVDALPVDIPAAIRRLWRADQQRDALALLYRASVDSMARRANVVLVPGATEAQCLRASRQLPLADERELFARVVRTWQYAAYAGRLPDTEEFDGLLLAASQGFGWAR